MLADKDKEMIKMLKNYDFQLNVKVEHIQNLTQRLIEQDKEIEELRLQLKKVNRFYATKKTKG